MSTDDDQIRHALSIGTPPVAAHVALREMGPSLRRARMRRRVAASATGAALLVGGGAGVFALTSDRDQTTLRSVTSDQTDQPLPTATEVIVSSTASTSTAALDEPPAVTEPPAEAPNPAPPDDVDGAPTERAENPAPPAAIPSPAVALPEVPAPAEEPPAPVAPPARFQTITSACGDVVVSIDAGAVQIVTIAARPGFDHSVTDGGPISIEMTFSGEDDVECEVHAELKSGELDVEVQSSEAER